MIPDKGLKNAIKRCHTTYSRGHEKAASSSRRPSLCPWLPARKATEVKDYAWSNFFADGATLTFWDSAHKGLEFYTYSAA